MSTRLEDCTRVEVTMDDMCRIVTDDFSGYGPFARLRAYRITPRDTGGFAIDFEPIPPEPKKEAA